MFQARLACFFLEDSPDWRHILGALGEIHIRRQRTCRLLERPVWADTARDHEDRFELDTCRLKVAWTHSSGLALAPIRE